MSDWVIDGIYRAVFPTGSQSATDQHVDEQTEQSTSGLVSLILQDDVAAVRAYLDTPGACAAFRCAASALRQGEGGTHRT